MREDGFTPVESAQRNRVRNLAAARDQLSQGDPQAAANALVHAQSAQRELDGGHNAPEGAPADVPDNYRDFIVSPSGVDKAMAQMQMVNSARERDGLAPLEVSVSRQTRPSSDDPLMAWQQTTLRVSGGTEEELRNLSIGKGAGSSAEKVVSTFGVLEASAAAVRMNGGTYVARRDGGNTSTPGRVDAYLADPPDGPMRQAMAPTKEDRATAREVRAWVRLQQPSSDYERAVRHSVSEDHMSMRDVGTASSAISGYLRHKEQLAMQQAAERSGQGGAPQGGGGPARPAGTSTLKSQSRWLGREGEKVFLPARVEGVHPIHHESRIRPHFLYIMRTPDGDLVRWMASRDAGLETGDDITLRGTVKGHSTFNGERQTEVFYCQPTIHNVNR